MKVRLLLAALAVAIFFHGQDIQAQDNAPPKESTATLEKTLNWLERHVETNFTYGYSTIENSAGTATASHYESSVIRTPVRFADCNISWRDHDQTVTVALADIDPASVATSLHAEANTKFDNELWELVIVNRDRKKSMTIQPNNGTVQTRDRVTLLFEDQENANRFARALQHAIKLCSVPAPPRN